ncbi:MAG: ATP synthase F1 subunit epsilon [Ruminococcaceae bacterium]|nr:ATP synthase F1 subunit epsilon [Oscillospiraceae bacterium]
MEDRIHLQVITPAAAVYDGPAAYVQLPLRGGSAGILPNHAPLLGAVEDGVVKYTVAGKDHYIAAGAGVAHVADNRVTVLASVAEQAENIDLARARSAEQRARERLAERSADVDTVRAEAALHRALVRQMAVRLMKK